jgi:hypothetical protein
MFTGCSAAMNYDKARKYHAEKQYRAALEAINVAVQANPDNEEYLSLRTRVVLDMYKFYGFPVMAYDYLVKNEEPEVPRKGIRKYDTVSVAGDREAMLEEIRRKFSIPIIIEFSDSTLGTDRLCILRRIKDLLADIPGNEYLSLRVYNFSDTDFLTEPKLSSSVHVRLSLEEGLKNVEKAKPRTVVSKYKKVTRRENREKHYLRAALAHAEKDHFELAKDYMFQLRQAHQNVGEQLYQVRRRLNMLDRNRRERETLKKSIEAQPASIEDVQFTDYEVTETDHSICLEMKFKCRIVDFRHGAVWKEDVIDVGRAAILTEVEGVHAADLQARANRQVTEKDIQESFSRMREEASLEVAERMRDEIVRIPYYRARDYEARGLLPDAWENFYVFLATEGPRDQEASEVRQFVLQDPLTFELGRSREVVVEGATMDAPNWNNTE